MAKVVKNNTSAANTLNAEEKFRLFLAGEEVEWEYSMLPLAISEFGEDEPVYDGLICPECGTVWSDYKSHSTFDSLYEGEHIVLDSEDVLLIYEEGECPHCRCRAIIEKNRPDETVQAMTFSHGLATPYGGHDVSAKEAFEKALAIKPEHEICCSLEEQQIGAFGVAVKGTVEIGSNIDLYSFVEDGERVFDPDSWRTGSLVRTASDIDPTKWDHMEFIVKEVKLQYFWIKEWALQDPEYAKLAETLRELGFKFRVVKARREAA